MNNIETMDREERFKYAFSADTSDEQVQGLYNAWAPTFDTDGDRHMYTAMLTTLAFAYWSNTRIRLLDVGCGTGLALEPMTALGYTNVVGIDSAHEMISVARSKGQYAELYTMGAGHLSFKDAVFEGAIATGCFTPGHAPVEGLAEVARVLVPGSHFILSLRTADVFDYRHELTRLFEIEYETSPFRPFPRTAPSVVATMVVCTL